MQHAHNHQVIKRQASNAVTAPDVGNFSGSETASGVQFGSSLMLSTAGPAATAGVSNQLVPGVPTLTLTSSSAPTQTDASSSQSSSSSVHSSSMSTGAILGISAGVFLVIIGAMFAAYTHFKRRTVSRASRAAARGPPLVVRGASNAGRERQWDSKGSGDRGEGKDKSSPGSAGKKRPDSGNLALFEKDLSVRSASDEKVTVSDNHAFDPSSMPNFSQYHPYLAGGLSNLPPSGPEGSTVVSWDGSTGSGDPLLTLRASASDTMSPTAVVARQTPQTTNSALHRWESAEVLIMDEGKTERPSVYSDISQDPFQDNATPRQSIGGHDSDSRIGGNPFFNAAQHNPFSDRSARSRKSSLSTARRSRANSVSSGCTVRPGPSEGALLSLIAALDHPPATTEDQTVRSSMQTVTTSIYAPTESSVVKSAPKAF